MELKELSQIYYINKEIKSLQLELAQIKQQSFYKNNIMSDMPRGGEKRDQNIEYVSEILLLEDLINYSLRKLQYQRKKIEDFLGSVDDAELRLIMRLRCVNNMGWSEIGDEVGMDRRTASRKFYAYFQKDAHNVTP